MKKRFLVLVAAVVAALMLAAFAGCTVTVTPGSRTPLVGDGQQAVAAAVELDGVHTLAVANINASNTDSLVIVVDETLDVDFEFVADKNIMDTISVTSADGVLKIEGNNEYRYSSKIWRILTSLPIKCFDIATAFDLEATGLLGDASLNLAGAGTVTLTAVELDSLDVAAAGLINFVLDGSVKGAKYALSGRLGVDAFGLLCKTVELDFVGTGSAELNASEKLTVNASGFVTVKYKGDPEVVDNSKNGVLGGVSKA